MSTTRKAVMFVGDSITKGDHDAPGMGWPGKVLMKRRDFVSAGNVHQLFAGPNGGLQHNMFLGENRSYLSGVNGQTIEGAEALMPTWIPIAFFTPTHFIIHLGVNNAFGADSAATMLTRLDNLLGVIHTESPSGKILVMKIINQGLSPSVQTKMDTYNAGIPTVVAGRSAYCNYGTMPTLTASVLFRYSDLQTVHQNVWGDVEMADAVITAMAAANW